MKKKIFPLNEDLTAPLAFFSTRKKIRLTGVKAMFNPYEGVRKTGIYFFEPYDPKKISVIFIHGLVASSDDWMSFINELNSNPDFRKKYQPCVFSYPSALPIPLSAILLRRALSDLAAHYPLKHNIILIGHSMGGIIAQMQVTNSGDILWNSILGANASSVKATLPNNSIIKQALVFKSSPYISKVIFIATPHRGSYWAALPLSSIPSWLIKLPVGYFQKNDYLTKSALQKINYFSFSAPSSIRTLVPNSPFLKALNKLSITVPYYSIIGNRGHKNESLEKSSDGIVPYWSSHLHGAMSECIVPAGHEAYESPLAVAEVLKILNLKSEN